MGTDAMLSATRLSKALGQDTKTVFKKLADAGCISREGDTWRLTVEGEKLGGRYQKSEKFGEFIVWPKSLVRHALFAELPSPPANEGLLSATRLGQSAEISAHVVNLLLAELGWIENTAQGWRITARGQVLGGVQKNGQQGFYVMWPEDIASDIEWQETVECYQGKRLPKSLDGHAVQCTPEQKICHWLYLHHICHAYQRALPGSEKTCSFFLPEQRIYIDYFGMENINNRLSDMLEKKQFIESHGFSYIELRDEDIQELEKTLPQKLLQYGLQIAKQ